jgi:hypothetical protein
MEHFNVDGTTLLSWTIQVQALNEREAVEEAERIAAWIELPSSMATVSAAQHHIVGWGLADSEDR